MLWGEERDGGAYRISHVFVIQQRFMDHLQYAKPSTRETKLSQTCEGSFCQSIDVRVDPQARWHSFGKAEVSCQARAPSWLERWEKASLSRWHPNWSEHGGGETYESRGPEV